MSRQGVAIFGLFRYSLTTSIIPFFNADVLKKYDKKLPQKSLFEPDITVEDQLKVAYRLKNKEIGYSPYTNNQKEEEYD